MWPTYVAAFLAVLSALLILTAQLSMPPWLLYLGLAIPFLTAPALHYGVDKGSNNPRSISFDQFFGPTAAFHLRVWWLACAYINALWAIRWLFGVENVITGIYGVDSNGVHSLKSCGLDHPYVTILSKCDFVLSSFLAHPWALYIHASGAVVTIALG